MTTQSLGQPHRAIFAWEEPELCSSAEFECAPGATWRTAATLYLQIVNRMNTVQLASLIWPEHEVLQFMQVMHAACDRLEAYMLLGTITVVGAPGLTTRSKDATRSKGHRY